MKSLNWSDATCLAWAITAVIGLIAPTANAQDKVDEKPISLKFNSVMRQYQRFSDQALNSWPQTNERVEKMGGWRTYAKEANQAEDSANEAASMPMESSDGASKMHHIHGGKP